MKNIIVSRESWTNCFVMVYYKQVGKANDIVELMDKEYGITNWVRLNLDEYRITFTDEKKMTCWMLKWA